MKIVFYASDKEREQLLAQSFASGCPHPVIIEPLNGVFHEDADIACMVGVKSNRLIKRCWDRGIQTLMFDKGYVRDKWPKGYWRVSLNAHHPTDTTLHQYRYPSDRFEALGLTIKPWRKSGLQVVFAGSSAKYHEFNCLVDPTKYARRIVKRLNELTDKPIIYRPKPSWRDAVPIRGSHHSGPKEPLQTVLNNAHCVITHGSNICFEAMLEGIPTIVLGNAVSRRIGSTKLEDVGEPLKGKRQQLLNNLAYHQWTLYEMEHGDMWDTIESWL